MGRCGCSGLGRQGQELEPAKAIGRIKFMPDNSRPFDPFTQASTAGDAPLPAPINDNGRLDAAHYGQLWGLVAHKRLDLIEARVAKLEKRRQLQVVGGETFETERACMRHELAVMDVQVATFFGIPIPDLPDDFWEMR
jgi:hypothetical protein